MLPEESVLRPTVKLIDVLKNPGGISSGSKLAVTEQRGKVSRKGNFQRKHFSGRSFQSAAVSEGMRIEMQVTMPSTHAITKSVCVCVCVCARARVRSEGPWFFKMIHRQSEKYWSESIFCTRSQHCLSRIYCSQWMIPLPPPPSPKVCSFRNRYLFRSPAKYCILHKSEPLEFKCQFINAFLWRWAAMLM